jgi:Concanavalin A-like lectin/glucanases superfamily
MMTLRWDGSTIDMFLNGITIGGDVTETAGPIVSNTLNFRIGNNPDYGNAFNGSIDDVRVYNRVLSDQDVLDLYNAGRASAPTVSDQAASPVSSSTATLNGSIDNDNYASSTVRGFQWGPTSSYGTIVPTTGTYGVGAFSTPLTGLTPNTIYYFRAFATNSAGTASSTGRTFTTNQLTAPVISSVASSTTATSSTITWTTSCAANSQIEYGTTTSYGHTNTLDETLVTSHSMTITSLIASTTYHFRVHSQNASSTDQTFTTAVASNAITQSMFYTTPGLYDGYYYSGGYHYYIAEPYAGHYVNASSTTVANPAWVVPDNTFYGDNTGAATSYAANENAILLSTTTGSSIPLDFQNLQPGVYFIRIAGRVNDNNIPRIVKPLVVDLKINDGPNGQIDDYQMQVLYTNSIEETGRIMFYALNTTNNLHGVLSLATSSQESLLVHRIDCFDALAGNTRTKYKTSATTYSSAQNRFAQGQAQALTAFGPYSSSCGFFGNNSYCTNNTIYQWMQNTTRAVPQGLSPSAASTRDDLIWNGFPPLNSMTDGLDGTTYYTEWPNGSTTAQINGQYGTWRVQTDLAPDANDAYGRLEYDQPFAFVNDTLGLTYTLNDLINHNPLPGSYPCKDSGYGCYFATSTYSSPGTYQFVVAPLVLYKMLSQYAGAIYGEGSTGGADLAYRYYVTADPNTGWDASLALVRFALQYPGLQAEAQDVGYNSANPELAFNANFRWSQVRTGKIQYTGWADPSGYIQAYDYLYPFIAGNQSFANEVHRYVPWVNTPDDVISLIDTYLLQTAYNDNITNRAQLNNPLLLGLVLQNGTMANNLLDISKATVAIDPYGTLSLKNHYHTSLNQDGTTFIGSMNYTMGETTPLLDSAQSISEYKQNTAQSVSFDTTNLTQWPKIAQYGNTFANILVAGGYRPSFGDSGDGIDGGRDAGS